MKNEIKSERKNIFILLGNDGYLKKFYSEKLINMYTEKDDIFNFQPFFSDCDLQAVYDSVLQFPVMCEKKVVILTDYDFEKCKSTDFDKLCTIVSDTPESCVFILLFSALEISVKKNNRLTKLIAAAEKNNGVAAELNHRTVPELIKMLCNGAKKRNCILPDSVGRYITEIVGDDIDTLKNELDKLCAYVGNGEITKETVDSVCVKTVEASVYTLSKHIIKCNMTAALKILDELFYLKVEPFVILSTISGFYVDLYRAFTGKERGMNAEEIAKDFSYGAKSFLIKNAMQDIRNFDYNRFELSFDALRNADKTIKSFSGDGRTAMECLIVKLGYIAAKGDSID